MNNKVKTTTILKKLFKKPFNFLKRIFLYIQSKIALLLSIRIISIIFKSLSYLTFLYFATQVALSHFFGIDLTQYLSNTVFIVFTLFNGAKYYIKKTLDLLNDLFGVTGAKPNVTSPNNNSSHDWTRVNEMKKTAEKVKEVLKDKPEQDSSNEFNMRTGRKTWSFFDNAAEIEAEKPKTWMSYINDNKYTLLAASVATTMVIVFIVYPEASHNAANTVYTVISGYFAGKSIINPSDPKSNIFDSEDYELGKSSNNTPKDISINDQRNVDIIPEATKALEDDVKNGSLTPKAVKPSDGAMSPEIKDWGKQADELKAQRDEEKKNVNERLKDVSITNSKGYDDYTRPLTESEIAERGIETSKANAEKDKNLAEGVKNKEALSTVSTPKTTSLTLNGSPSSSSDGSSSGTITPSNYASLPNSPDLKITSLPSNIDNVVIEKGLNEKRKLNLQKAFDKWFEIRSSDGFVEENPNIPPTQEVIDELARERAEADRITKDKFRSLTGWDGELDDSALDILENKSTKKKIYLNKFKN